jgi:hypothetical protein
MRRAIVSELSRPTLDLGANLIEQLLERRVRLGLDFDGGTVQLLACVLGGFPRPQADGQPVRRLDRLNSPGTRAIHG